MTAAEPVLRVALKFCGGCNPDYDRREYWEDIRAVAAERLAWGTLDSGGFQAVLLICGCGTACIEREMPTGVPLVCRSDNYCSAEAVVKELLEKGVQSCPS